jgi:RNA polymerase sigma factor (sigma-70 family)
MKDALDDLLERLTRGEMDAAGEVYRMFEPVLRVMVRRRLSRRLRAKFDSNDVVQSAWADVLIGFRNKGWRFRDREHLWAYLASVTCNHLADCCHRHGRMIEHERPLGSDERLDQPASAQPRPSELAQAGELWELLLSLCPPAHRKLLQLKRRGYRLAEIAARTGLHESSVRRIVYDLERKLAAVRAEMSAASVS